MTIDQSRLRSWLGSAAIFVASTAGAALAQNLGRPISASLIYVMGVTVIGAYAGLRGGLAAAVLASAIYNFFLSEPVLQFSASSADEYVPLIAFNLTAVISGMLAGRLNDRARTAERAQGRINALLSISDRLQKAVTMADITSAMNGEWVTPWWRSFELYDRSGNFIPFGLFAPQWHDVAKTILTGWETELIEEQAKAYRLENASGVLGVAIFDRWPESRSQPAIDMDALIALLSMAVERCILLQQRSEAEAIRRSEAFKTALLSSLSHDMRTPLSAIAASASSLISFSDDLEPGVRTGMLNTIKEQCERLNRYTANLLDMGQLQAGISEDKLSDVDVIEILGVALGSARTTGATHPISKHIECASAMVRANPVMVEQLLCNIIDNAMCYSQAGKPIAVKASVSGPNVRIDVIDQGCGIPAKDLPHVLDRFYRSSRTRHLQGQGLGLSIAQGFAEAFGGSVRVYSPHAGGPGTQVVVELPLIDKRREHVDD